jgi:predicted DNA-binding transcriptional regulator YafY
MKSNQERLDFWNKQFNSLDEFTPHDLIMRFDRQFKKKIAQRTLQDDLKKLRKWIAPHELHNKRFDNRNSTLTRSQKSFYFYKEPYLPKPEFMSEDAKCIQEVLSVLNQFQYLPYWDDLKEVLSKIEQQLNQSDTSSNGIPEIIGFEQVPKVEGSERIPIFIKAIREQQVQFIYYQSFDEPTKEVRLHPYYLKEFNKRWYIYGLNHDDNKVLPYGLDRILSQQPTPIPFIPSTIDFRTYFKNRIGITFYPDDKRYEVCNIRLKVSKFRANYIDTKPWHHSQVAEKRTDTHVYYRYELVVNKELEAQILQFGRDIEVLEPLSLREKIHAILQEASDYYKK